MRKLVDQIQELLKVLDALELPNARLVSLAVTGVGGTKVCVVQLRGKKLVVKYGRAKISLEKQIENRNLLAQYFEENRLPKVIKYIKNDEFGEAMVIEFCGDFTFHEVTTRGLLSDASCKEIMKSILVEVFDVWKKTKKEVKNGDDIPFSYDPRERTKRIIAALEDFEVETETASYRLGDFFDHSLIINGTEYPCLHKVIQQLSEFHPPTFLVTCHRDLNADNFIIALNGGEPNWSLIDWEWAGERHDWRLSLSHLLAWWKANAIYLRKDPIFRPLGKNLLISYDVRTPSVCRDFGEFCKSMGKDFAREVEDANWEEQLKSYIALYLLGEIRFVEGRAREEYVIPLIGEGIVSLYK